jgi:predicted transcriptional regulator of viral defense system
MGAYLQVDRWDRAIADIATRQHGVVSHAQLLGIGLGRGAIRHRVEAGRLHRLHRGVYSVGHRVVSERGTWMAAVLAGGSRAVLSHRDAAALWGLRPNSRRRSEISVPGARHQLEAIQFHCGHLQEDEQTVVDGIPLTTVPRTLLDLATVLAPRYVERAIDEAEFRRLTDPLSLHDLLARYPRRRGSGVIRAILATHYVGSGLTRSELEDLFLAFLDRYGLPRPEVNVALWLGDRWIEADCVWRGKRVIVELDGRAAHDTAAAYEDDRARDRAATVAGWRTVRVTWAQLHGHEDALATDLRALLA